MMMQLQQQAQQHEREQMLRAQQHAEDRALKERALGVDEQRYAEALRLRDEQTKAGERERRLVALASMFPHIFERGNMPLAKELMDEFAPGVWGRAEVGAKAERWNALEKRLLPMYAVAQATGNWEPYKKTYAEEAANAPEFAEELKRYAPMAEADKPPDNRPFMEKVGAATNMGAGAWSVAKEVPAAVGDVFGKAYTDFWRGAGGELPPPGATPEELRVINAAVPGYAERPWYVIDRPQQEADVREAMAALQAQPRAEDIQQHILRSYPVPKIPRAGAIQ